MERRKNRKEKLTKTWERRLLGEWKEMILKNIFRTTKMKGKRGSVGNGGRINQQREELKNLEKMEGQWGEEVG